MAAPAPAPAKKPTNQTWMVAKPFVLGGLSGIIIYVLYIYITFLIKK